MLKCSPKIFNSNISYNLFYYEITFINSQHNTTNSKGDFVHKKGFRRSFERFMLYKNKSDSEWYNKLN